MFVKSKNYDNYIVKYRIEIGKELGLEEDSEAFIEMHELSTIDTLKLKDEYAKGEIAIMEYYKNVLPACISDHNLYVTEQQKMTNEEVTALIFENTKLAMKVVGEFVDKTFFTQTKEESNK